jgi:hypothetical protein
MLDRSTRIGSTAKHVGGTLMSILLGGVGGMICGAMILSLCGLSGRSRTTGEEYVGYWNIGLVLVGAMYGGPLGVVLGPISYVLIVRNIGFMSAIIPAAVGTIICGYIGSIITPLAGIPTGVMGFFIGLLIARQRSLRRVAHP